jgi:hypothetical protein
MDLRLKDSGKLVGSRYVRVATGATVPATQQAPIYRPDTHQQDDKSTCGETLQDQEDESKKTTSQ